MIRFTLALFAILALALPALATHQTIRVVKIQKVYTPPAAIVLPSTDYGCGNAAQLNAGFAYGGEALLLQNLQRSTYSYGGANVLQIQLNRRGFFERQRELQRQRDRQRFRLGIGVGY